MKSVAKIPHNLIRGREMERWWQSGSTKVVKKLRDSCIIVVDGGINSELIALCQLYNSFSTSCLCEIAEEEEERIEMRGMEDETQKN